MSKQKTRQRKNARKQARSTAQRHEHQVAVETKHHVHKASPKNLIVLFLIYLVILLAITALIDWMVGDVFDAPLVYLIPFVAAVVLTYIHQFQGWKMPQL